MENIKKIVNMVDSDLYNNDTDFKTEEEKDDYYLYGEFWSGDTDLIKLDDNDDVDEFKTIYIQCIDNEIFVYQYDELTDELILMIERFYNSDWEQHFTPLMVGNDYNYKDDKKYNPNLPKMWYRGNSGHYYYCHQYNYPVSKC